MRAKEREDSWFTNRDELIGHLKECHQSDDPLPQVDGYEDLAFLQRGGQGTVYLARRKTSGRREALKVFHPETFSSAFTRRRFEREIHFVSRLKHPGIVRLFHWGRARDERPFLAMEYVDGQALDEFLKGASVEKILEVFLEICDALAHAHRRGVIHRDLKPGNVRVDANGHARLLDFGLAKELKGGAEGSSALSTSGGFVGTLAWASPEQVRGSSDQLDIRTDVYSLGVMLYRALANRSPTPIEGGFAEIARGIEDSIPRAPSRWNDAIGRDLDTVVLRCLSKERERRYPTVSDLARDLEHVLDKQPIEARRDGLGFLAWSMARKHPVPTVLGALALIAVMTLAVVSTILTGRARESEQSMQVALAGERAEAKKFAIVNEFLLGNLLGPAPSGTDPRELRLAVAVDNAAPRIESDPTLTDKPGVRADLHLAMAYWFVNLTERLDVAEEHTDLALGLYEDAESPEHAGLAWAQELTAGIAIQRGDYQRASRFLKLAIASYKAGEADELNVARTTGQLISAAFALDEFDGIKPYLEDYKAIVTRQFGEDDQRVLNVRGAMKKIEARLEKAE